MVCSWLAGKERGARVGTICRVGYHLHNYKYKYSSDVAKLFVMPPQKKLPHTECQVVVLIGGTLLLCAVHAGPAKTGRPGKEAGRAKINRRQRKSRRTSQKFITL